MEHGVWLSLGGVHTIAEAENVPEKTSNTHLVISSSGDTLTLKSAKLRREPRPGDKVTLKLRDPGVKHIGEEFSFRPRNQFDEDEQRLMDKVKSARQSRKIRNYFLRSEGFF